MRTVLLFAMVMASSAAAAQSIYDETDEEVLRVTGGWAVKPGTQKGEVVYVNCQSSAKSEWIAESANYFAKESVLKVTLNTGKFDIKAPAVVGNLSLFIVDDPALPMSLIAPEARWALVNVATLKSDKMPFFRARVKKELARVFCMLCGGFRSNFSSNLTGYVGSAKDLDTFMNAQIPIDVLGRIPEYLAPCGVKPGLMLTYEDACHQGWASAPTNKWQRAIWDKVHTPPTKPIKITYDKGKQKPVVK